MPAPRAAQSTMKISSQQLRLSATDVSNHLACHHLTKLGLSVARGNLVAPELRAPDLVMIQQLGLRFESQYLEFLRKGGLEVVHLGELKDEMHVAAETQKAMQVGFPVIAQGALSCGRWFGRPDVLRRVDKPSARFGNWSYEAYDCKLARETKAAAILQLSFYSELLGEMHGGTVESMPENMWIVHPGTVFKGEKYRVAEYAAYYRYVKGQLEKACTNGTEETYPEPCAQCEICQWFQECDERRRVDDHLSLVAGIRRLQRNQLEMWKCDTVTKLAGVPIPLKEKPLHGSRESMERVREQARVQIAGRVQQKPVHELLKIEPDIGFCRLPEPSPGDMFVDLEGDPFAGDLEACGGHQYLFGFVTENGASGFEYQKQWSFDAQEERKAFEWLVDAIKARQQEFPGMHVFHFGVYEPSKFRYLMGRYATRQEQIDGMLRAGVFVDLHLVLTEAVRASVEEYTLKKIEAFYGFKRTVSLEESRVAMRYIEHRLQMGWGEQQPLLEHRDAMERYNADDCRSTAALRAWLECERAKKSLEGRQIQRFMPKDSEPKDDLKEWQQRVAALVKELTTDIPADAKLRSREQKAQWLMAQLIDWHWRDAKPAAWQFYSLADKNDEQLLDERKALSGLVFERAIENPKGKIIHRYSFPKQETDVRPGKEMWHRQERIGNLIAIDAQNRTVDIEKSEVSTGIHPASVFARDPYRKQDAQRESLYRIALWIKDHGVDSPGLYRAGRDLLLRNPPRLQGSDSDIRISDVEEFAAEASRIVRVLDASSLPIQGPPGSGKTTSGAEIIHDLVRSGKKVGVCATGHEVIHLLLRKIISAPNGDKIRCLHKCDKGTYEGDDIATTSDNKVPIRRLKANLVDVVGATAWMWCRPEYADAVDVLVFDEAGQMSLADVLTASPAARDIVLIGDPQQLPRPQKGSHPEGAELSALEHVLFDRELGKVKIMPPELGLFIPKTKRLHPNICEFTSEVFYESKLQAIAFTANRTLSGHHLFDKPGLYFVPIHHQGNCNYAPQEVNVIATIVESLLKADVKWFYGTGHSAPLKRERDILIVAPYNAQVSDLAIRLPGLKVGTVDKFQGQEAPIVIYSLRTSSPEDAPRGMEFLYSLNRFNVATSRAMSNVIVVGSPRLFEPECKSPRQMQLANALCRFRELATEVQM
jgi:predicted RecB family nuclease